MEVDLPPTENGVETSETSEKETADENSDESKTEENLNNGTALDQNDNSTEEKTPEQDEHIEETNEDDSKDDNTTENPESVKSADNVERVGKKKKTRSVKLKENGSSETNEKTDKKDEETESKDQGTHEDNFDDEFDINPLLLCPDISMDVDESPVVTTSSGAEANTDSLDASSLFEPLFSTFVDEMTGAEISFNLTAEEQKLREQMYGPNNPIEFSKVHCTACNVHLGSALAGQTNRFVHPLLKVLVCKECYNFYMSGEFEKDEDGSELYCRWCGQGGQVLCCTKCEYVFCKKCIRINFGRKKLTEVRDSDEWQCFRCDMSQLKTLRAMCVEFFEYVKRETARAAAVGDENYMNRDLTNCCQTQIKKRIGDMADVEQEVKKPKRKKTVEDPDYDPFSEEKDKLKEPKQEEVVPVAGPSGVSNVNKLPQLTPKPVATTNNVITMPGLSPTPTIRIGNTIINVNSSKTGTIPTTTLRMLGPNMRPTMSPTTPGAPKTNVVYARNRQPVPRPNFQGTTQRFTLVSPGTSKMPNSIRMSPSKLTQVRSTPPKLVPTTPTPSTTTISRESSATSKAPMKHEWFEKTVRSAARVNSNLSYTLTQLNKAQANAASVEQLAVVHNKLQEILSSSINSLIQIRKNLRTEFIAGIKSIKFPPKPKVNQNHNNDDDDVVIVSSSTSEVSKVLKPKSKFTPMNSQKVTTLKPIAPKVSTTPKVTVTSTNSNQKRSTPTSISLPSGGYLKVRSFSQLQTVPSECITIPDDEPPKNTVADNSGNDDSCPKDPLAEDPISVENGKQAEDPLKIPTTSMDKDSPVDKTDSDDKDSPIDEAASSDKDSPLDETPAVDDASSVDKDPSNQEDVDEDSTNGKAASTREDSPVDEAASVREDSPIDKGASTDTTASNDKTTKTEEKKKKKKKKRGVEKKTRTDEEITNNTEKEESIKKKQKKETEKDDTEKDTENKSAENNEEAIDDRLTNGSPEGRIEEVRVKEEPRDCPSYNILEKPSPKIRRMLSVKVNLKKTPIIEDMVKKEPIENGG